MKISAAAIERLRTADLGPDHFIRCFGALSAVIEHTGNPNVAVTLDYGDEPGPDELIPVITLSFKSRHEETSQEHREETSPQTSPEVPGSPADGHPV